MKPWGLALAVALFVIAVFVVSAATSPPAGRFEPYPHPGPPR